MSFPLCQEQWCMIGTDSKTKHGLGPSTVHRMCNLPSNKKTVEIQVQGIKASRK